MSLTDCLQTNGAYNITTDNFFSSVEVAALLQSKEITVIETVRANSKRLSKEITGNSKESFSNKFLQC